MREKVFPFTSLVPMDVIPSATIGGSGGPRAALDAIEKRNICSSYQESIPDPSVAWPTAYSLYRPSYLGSLLSEADLPKVEISALDLNFVTV